MCDMRCSTPAATWGDLLMLTSRRRTQPPQRARGPVAVIGAGPYGLATAAHLRGAGIEVRSFGEPLQFWKANMPKGMILRSRDRSSSISDPRRALTIADYERAESTTVHKPHLELDEFVRYALWFQGRALPDVDPRRVANVSNIDGEFRVELDSGEAVPAARIVVAAGLSPFPYCPPAFSGLPRSLVSHSAEHRDLGVFAGKRMAVIGAGQSALESAALLADNGADIEVFVRAGGVRWLADEDGDRPPARKRFSIQPPPTDVGGRLSGWLAALPGVQRTLPRPAQTWVYGRCVRPAGAGWLRPRLGAVPIRCGRSVISATADGGELRLRLDDNSERVVDHVLLGTGYAVDVAGYTFLDRQILLRLQVTDGYPVLGPGLESSVRGLHFVGAPAAFSFGPIMRFVVGTWYAAPATAGYIAGQRAQLLRRAF